MANPFETPAPTEKLAYRFILDSLRESALSKDASRLPSEPCESLAAEAAPVQETVVETIVETVTTVEVSSPVEAMSLLTAEAEQTLQVQAEELESPEKPYVPPTLAADKKYFRIGEVSSLLKVEPYVLRYWETEFRSIKPVKSGSGHRVYSRKDVETLAYVRHLLHEEKFSIKGAKQKLLDRKKSAAQPVQKAAGQKQQELLKSLSHELKSLIQLARHSSGLWS